MVSYEETSWGKVSVIHVPSVTNLLDGENVVVAIPRDNRSVVAGAKFVI
ncbi:hypothetical protein SAMN05421752_1317 [Natronorubrum thiooxidans]|uniref:Uncharacterized protein n=1 Tax=Natronorubrum thiooxidans TaxID=308853 RepID=A0A1N7H869_9EURY|nr:hypothetical protein SAMN05421752_1317 [Natronorubrum thiooxidans]